MDELSSGQSAAHRQTFSDWLLRPLRRVTSSGLLVPEIDGLRCLAIAAVMAHHWLVMAPSLEQSPVGPAMVHGAFGVQLFFAISGFILALPFVRQAASDGPPPSLRHYFLRRLTRLEPPFVISLAVFVAIQLARSGNDFSAAHALASLTYTHSLVYGQMSTINNVLWSLEVEVQFYLLMPALAFVFRFRHQTVRWLILGSLAAASAVLHARYGHDASGQPTRIGLSLVGQGAYFLVGMMLADGFVRAGTSVRRRGYYDLFSLAAVALFVMLAGTSVMLLVMPLVVFLFVLGTLYGRTFRTVFANAWIATVGGMCYTIYLYHFAILRNLTPVLHRVLPNTQTGLIVQGVVAGIMAVLICVPLFLLFEKPFMRRDWTAAFGQAFHRVKLALRPAMLVAIVVLATVPAAFAAGPTTRAFGGDKEPAIALAVPRGWIATTVPGSRRDAVSVRFNAREPAGASAMNLMFKADPPGRPTDDNRLRDLVTEAARTFLDDSVEKRANLQPLGDGADGYVVTLTDTTPGTSKRNYACATIVGRRFGGGVLLANLLHPKDSVQLPSAMQMVRTAALPASAQPATAPATTQTADELRLVSPDGTWVVVLNWPGLPAGARASRSPVTRQPDGTIIYSTTRPTGTSRPAATDAAVRIDVTADDGTELSLSIDPAPVPGDARAARDFLIEHRLKPQKVVRKMTISGTADAGLVAFTTGGPNRAAVATRVHSGRWVVANISNPMATDADQRAMTQALKAMRIEPVVATTAPAAGTTTRASD